MGRCNREWQEFEATLQCIICVEHVEKVWIHFVGFVALDMKSLQAKAILLTHSWLPTALHETLNT